MPAARTVVVIAALLALGGCGTAGAARALPSPSTSSEATPSAWPSAEPITTTPSAGHLDWDSAQQQARFAAAASYIAKRPGKLGVIVTDRTTAKTWRTGVTTEATWTASTIKLAIAADLLERHRAGTIALTSGDRANLRAALVDSSNDAAHALWTKYDGVGALPRYRDRYGMRGLSVVPGFDPYWRHLRCTAEDLHALMTYVLTRLNAGDRAYLVDTLRSVNRNQRWGVWAAGTALRPGLKAGWAEKPDPGGAHWVTHSVGFAGPSERYVIAVWHRLTPSGSLSSGVQAVSDTVALVFGAPTPAKVSAPT
jgi:hypothetical protein